MLKSPSYSVSACVVSQEIPGGLYAQKSFIQCVLKRPLFSESYIKYTRATDF